VAHVAPIGPQLAGDLGLRDLTGEQLRGSEADLFLEITITGRAPSPPATALLGRHDPSSHTSTSMTAYTARLFRKDRRVSRLLTITQAADQLGTGPRFVRRLIAERRIPFHKVGRHVRIAESDLINFVAAGRIEAL
jgi:excisionase family DNA binding protein